MSFFIIQLTCILIDYLETSENQISSLMMRYDTLYATNRALVTDLEDNATEVCQPYAYVLHSVVTIFTKDLKEMADL